METPRHQVPWNPLRREHSRLEAGDVHAVETANVAGGERDVEADLFRHLRRERPVAAEVEVRRGFLHFRDIMVRVVAVRLAMKVSPLVPVGIGRGDRDLLDSSRFGERLLCLVAIIDRRPPDIPVDPRAVQLVIGGEFCQLRNEQRIRIGAKDRGVLCVAVPVGQHPPPCRMEFHRPVVPNSGMMRVQGNAATGRHVPPDLKRIADEIIRVIADSRRIAGNARMTFRVDFDVVRMERVDDRIHHVTGRVFAQLSVVHLRVKVEMNAEETVRPA